MTENSNITNEQREALREKYGTSTKSSTDYPKALGIISGLGFALAVISIIAIFSVTDLLAVTIWGSLLGAGVTAGFFALIAYLAVKALLDGRE